MFSIKIILVLFFKNVVNVGLRMLCLFSGDYTFGQTKGATQTNNSEGCKSTFIDKLKGDCFVEKLY